MLEVCSGPGEAKVLTRSSQMGAAHAGMKMDTLFQHSSLVWASMGFLSTLPLRWIPSYGLMAGLAGVLLFLRAWEERLKFSSHSSFQCVKDVQWFQHVHDSVTSSLRSDGFLSSLSWEWSTFHLP